jgi:solute:Na+ symporter, SSS family
VFASFLKVVVPLAVLLPGIVAFALYKDAIPKPDQAYSILVGKMVPAGFVGLIIAGLVAAIVSSLNSMVNSTATIFTMDIYRKINQNASEKKLVLIGRIVSVVVVLIAIPIAPYLKNLDQAFQYIQEYTGMVSPGVTVIFFMGLFWRRATATAAMWMAILTIPVSAALKFIPIYLIPGTLVGRFLDPFLNRMGVAMIILFVVGYFITMATPYVKHDKYEKMEESVSFKTSMIFNIFAILILGVLMALYLIFR